MSGPTATRAPGAVLPLDRFRGQVPEIAAAAVLSHRADGAADARWGAAADGEAALGAELLRWFWLCDGDRPYENATGAAAVQYVTGLAERGVALSELHEWTRTVVARVFAELWSRAEPPDVTALLRFSRWMSANRSAMARAMVRAHREGRDDPERAATRRRTAAALRLLAGEPVDDPAVPVAPGYLVVVAHPPLPRPGAAGSALTADHDGRLIALYGVPCVTQRQAVWEAAAAVHGRSSAAGAFADTPQDVPAAARLARRVADAATAVGLPAGLIGQRELALELTLDGSPGSLQRMAHVLDPLAGDPRLLETLSRFLDLDLDRTRTAAAMGLSRRGLSLRLDRVTALTGFDPRGARGVQVLSSALASRALIALREAG